MGNTAIANPFNSAPVVATPDPSTGGAAISNPFDTPSTPQQSATSTPPPTPTSAFGRVVNDMSATVGQTSDLLKGAGEGVLSTISGAGDLIRKGLNAVGNLNPNGNPNQGDSLIPPSGQAALNNLATPANTTQTIGKTAEDVAEFVLGDEALKGLSLGDKLLKVGKVAETYEKATPFVKAAIEHGMTAARVGTVAGIDTAAKTGDVGEGAKAAAIGVVASPVAEAVGAGIGKAASALKALVTDIPADVESKLVSTVADAAKDAGFEPSEADTLKDSVADLGNQFKTRAQSVYQELDSEAPGFQDLKEKTQQLQKAYRMQVNVDPAKADDIAGELKTAQQNMSELLDKGQQARWKAADQDWSRFKAIQQFGIKTAKSAEDLTDSALTSVDKLHTAAQQLTNSTRAGNPIDLLSRAFGDHAEDIRSIVQKGANITSSAQAAKQFLKWAGGITAGVSSVGGATYAIKKALSGKH